MSKFIDENKATWDIKTTSVQIDNEPAKGDYVATIDDAITELDYSGNQFPLDNSATFPTGTTITWPKSGNPMLKGSGGEKEAVAAIRAFAARVKAGNLSKVAVIKVRASPPDKETPAQPSGGNDMLMLLLLVGFVYFVDKR